MLAAVGVNTPIPALHTLSTVADNSELGTQGEPVKLSGFFVCYKIFDRSYAPLQNTKPKLIWELLALLSTLNSTLSKGSAWSYL